VGDVTLWLIPALGQTGAGITTRTNAEGVYELSVHPDRYMMLIVHPDYVLDARPVLRGPSSRAPCSMRKGNPW
jgi:hypothetical protein